jgi:hypothetical protein
MYPGNASPALRLQTFGRSWLKRKSPALSGPAMMQA